MTSKPEDDRDDTQSLTFTLGHEQLVIRRRYEALSMLNDFAIGIWFLVGSVFFLYPSLKEAGAWLFVIGSAQFVLRPMIRLAHRLHVRHVPASNWEF